MMSRLNGGAAAALLAIAATAAGGVAVASQRSAAVDAKAAAGYAAKAAKLLARKQAVAAVTLAEQAVSFAPRDARYRALLGQSYLQAGRFVSARDALGEAMSLDPTNGRAALNLTLAQIATGDWAAARRTLQDHADVIPAADRGLALALSGDPASAVKLLTEVARSDRTSVTARQNLALSLALAGQWQAARMVAAADLSPAQLDGRMADWAAFAQPSAASDQVASLLGVAAAADPGRPAALALSAPAPAPVALAAAAPARAPAAVTPPTVVPTVEVAAAAPSVVFAARQEVVQPLPVQLIRPAPGLIKVALTGRPQPLPTRTAPTPPRATTGEWYVQLGAFDSPAVARDAWGRATRRFAAFGARTPTGMNFSAGGRSFYRLSVGGFARADAVAACERYRARGGACFVRQGAGDQVAAWTKPGRVQLAMR